MVEPDKRSPFKMQPGKREISQDQKENESKIHIVVRNGDKSVDIDL
jgi:hypothetical protein